MRVYYTARLRTHDMGILQLGFVTFPIHFIPPGAESFLSYGLCKTEKFEEVMPRVGRGGKPGSPTPRPEPPPPRACGLALREIASLGPARERRGPGFEVPGVVGGKTGQEGPEGPQGFVLVLRVRVL